MDFSDFLNLLGFFNIFGFLLNFFLGFYEFLSKFLRLLQKVTEVTTGHQKWPKMGQNNVISSFFFPKAKTSLGQSPPQELEVGPWCKRYLLVFELNIS